MNEEFQEDMKFDAAAEAADDGEGLILDMDGYGGPLHLPVSYTHLTLPTIYSV